MSRTRQVGYILLMMPVALFCAVRDAPYYFRVWRRWRRLNKLQPKKCRGCGGTPCIDNDSTCPDPDYDL